MLQLNDVMGLCGQAAQGLMPPPRMSIVKWSEAHVILDRANAAEPGPYRADRIPYIKEPLEHLSLQSDAKGVVVMKGAQLGFTQAGLNWIGYIVHLAPAPMLIVLPTVEVAKRWSKQRLNKMINSSEVLSALIAPARSRDSGNNILMKEFRGGVMIITGANSAVGLRSMPVQFRMYDECDAFPADADGEGDPIALAEKRSMTYSRDKFFMPSTPTIENMSRIHAAFLKGSQAVYHVPCPECEAMQVIEWPRIRWQRDDNDEAILETVCLECEACGVAIEERHKTFMLAHGKWVHRFPEREVKSYHISSLCSPLGWYSWADAVRDWEEAKAKRGTDLLKVFINTVLGELWEERGEAPDWRRLYDRREDYKVNTVPKEVAFLTAGVDVQKNRLELEVVGWCEDGQSYSIDYRVLPGDTEQSEVWLNLEALLTEVFPTERGGNMQLLAMAVDSGYATQEVYKWVRTHSAHRVFSIKGRNTGATAVGVPKTLDVRKKGERRVYRGVQLWPLNVDMLKGELYGWLRLDSPTDESDEGYPANYCHFPKYVEEYFHQLTAEQRITVIDRKGFKRYEWRKIFDRNEALDCRVYARAAALIINSDKWVPGTWAGLIKKSMQPIDAITGKKPRVSKAKRSRKRKTRPTHMK